MDPGIIDILKKEFKPVGELTAGETIKYAKVLIEKNERVRSDFADKIRRRTWESYDAWVQLSNLPQKDGIRAQKNGIRAKGEKVISAIQYLQAALDEHRRADEAVIQINSLFHRLHNGRNSLAKEKRILREIKCAQEHKEKLCLDFQPENYWWIPQDLQKIATSKKIIKEQKELLFQELPVLRKQKKECNSKTKQLEEILEAANKDIDSLQKQRESIIQQNKRLNMHVRLCQRDPSILCNEPKVYHPYCVMT